LKIYLLLQLLLRRNILISQENSSNTMRRLTLFNAAEFAYDLDRLMQAERGILDTEDEIFEEGGEKALDEARAFDDERIYRSDVALVNAKKKMNEWDVVLGEDTYSLTDDFPHTVYVDHWAPFLVTALDRQWDRMQGNSPRPVDQSFVELLQTEFEGVRSFHYLAEYGETHPLLSIYKDEKGRTGVGALRKVHLLKMAEIMAYVPGTR
jgi:hypothetical protein